MEKTEKIRKRGRKKIFKDRQEGNRVRSQRHRENLNNYISKLEQEVKELKKNVTNLSQQLEYYKKLIKEKNIALDIESDNFKFLREEEYCLGEYTNVITNIPMLIKQVNHVMNWENSGPMSDSRIKFIK